MSMIIVPPVLITPPAVRDADQLASAEGLDGVAEDLGVAEAVLVAKHDDRLGPRGEDLAVLRVAGVPPPRGTVIAWLGWVRQVSSRSAVEPPPFSRTSITRPSLPAAAEYSSSWNFEKLESLIAAMCR